MPTERPALLPTRATDTQYAGVTYHLEGELVPVLTVEVSADAPIYFEHHVVLWKNPSVGIGLKKLKGAFKRFFAGMPILMTESHGSGQIAFSRDEAGHVVPMHLKRGQSVYAREHQFLAATQGINFSFERLKGFKNWFFGSNDFFLDKFTCEAEEGIVWLYGYGNLFELTLAEGEHVDVEPGAWVFRSPKVKMDTTFASLKTGLLGGMQLPMNRFSGPGKLGVQSLFYVAPTPDGADDDDRPKPNDQDGVTQVCVKLLGPGAGSVVGFVLKIVLGLVASK